MKQEVAVRYYDCDRAEMLQFVPGQARTTLEIGCANGRFSTSLKRRQNCEAWGIELNADAAAIAALTLDKVLSGDVFEILDGLPDDYFDCVICNDILEHLPVPERVLQGLKRKLASKGVIVASIPNMRYLPVLYELLISRDWKYRDSGVLDRTHLRFFTAKSMDKLFVSSGYKLLQIKGLRIQTRPFYTLIFTLIYLLSLGFYGDTRYIQYACVAGKASD